MSARGESRPEAPAAVATGSRPTASTSRRRSAAVAALLLAVVAGTASAQSPPAWRGVWIAEGLTADISGFPPDSARWYKLLGDQAPWNEHGLERVQTARMNQATLKADGWGFPLMMDSAAPFTLVMTPNETMIVNMYRDVRHIYTDGRALPAAEDRWPTTWGTSVGRWEGDTLVVETVSVREPTVYFFSAPPLSEEARYVERLRMTAPDRIESTMTIVDPVTLSEPWVVELVYVPAPNMDRMIYDDYANDRSEVDGETFTIVPAEE